MDALAWCREKMLVPAQPLTASLLFADPGVRDQILVTRTLGAELLALAEGSTEPALLAARLDWWQGALGGQADHPALMALAQTGVQRRVSGQDFLPLLDAVARLGAQPRLERFEEFQDLGRATGGRIAELEFGICAQGKAEAAEQKALAIELGAAGWILRRVRDVAADANRNCWLLPLDLQAQFQISRQDVLDARGGPDWQGLVQTLVARALKSGDRAAVGLDPVHRHLIIHWSVEKRLAARLVRSPDDILKRRLLPGHAGNVWAAWRAARRLAKRAG